MKLKIYNRSQEKMRFNLLQLGIITVVTVVIWISVSVYNSYSKPVIDPEIEAVIRPINPSLDNQILMNYSSTRLRPPEKFEVISVIKEGNQINQILIDPYGIATPTARVSNQTQQPVSESGSAQIITQNDANSSTSEVSSETIQDSNIEDSEVIEEAVIEEEIIE